MRKLFLIIALAFTCVFVNAQTLVVKGSNQTEQSMVAHSTKTGQTFEGKTVYKSSKGSLFVVVVSKKTGKPYKKYLEVKK
jgi:hypothetical protein